MQWNNTFTSNNSLSRLLHLRVCYCHFFFFLLILQKLPAAVCHNHGSLFWRSVWCIHPLWIAEMLSEGLTEVIAEYISHWELVVQRTDGLHLEKFYWLTEQSRDGSRVSGYSELSQTAVMHMDPSFDYDVMKLIILCCNEINEQALIFNNTKLFTYNLRHFQWSKDLFFYCYVFKH